MTFARHVLTFVRDPGRARRCRGSVILGGGGRGIVEEGRRKERLRNNDTGVYFHLLPVYSVRMVTECLMGRPVPLQIFRWRRDRLVVPGRREGRRSQEDDRSFFKLDCRSRFGIGYLA
jgi:hypothetical protein